MEKLREYKAVILAGLAVLLFLAAAYLWVGNAGETDTRYTYAEHLFREGVVNEIDIQIAEADWQDMLENPLAEEFHCADVVINGETMGNVAIRTKGNTSLTSVASSDSDRYSFKLDFDYYENGGNYYGLKKLNLNNNFSDDSNMREYISYQILDEMGVPAPDCGYAHITVNGEEWGLYLAVEAIDEVFLETRFGESSGDLYKPEEMGGTGADLVYRGADISLYTGLNPKTNENGDGSAILALMRALESGEGLEETLDVDEALRYLAVNTALANFDSYLGGTTHNFYLYEQDGVFSILPWDFNLSFGGFGGGEVDIYNPVSDMGGGPGGGDGNRPEGAEAPPDGNQPEGETTPPDGSQPEGAEIPPDGNWPERGPSFSSDRRRMEMPDMPSGDGEKPLVTTLLANEDYLAAYEGYLREMAETWLSQEYLTAQVEQLHDLIAPYVEKDATAFCTYEEFEQACSTDPQDEYSLVYFGVNMAESIMNQLAGGEPTFDTSSMKGGGFGGGMGGGPRDMPENERGGMPAFDGEGGAPRDMPEDERGGMPAFDGEGGGPRDMPEEGRDGMPAFGGGNGGPEHRDMRQDPPGMPGMENRQQINLQEILPILAVCGGVFAAGLAFVLAFRRKKELKPPKE